MLLKNSASLHYATLMGDKWPKSLTTEMLRYSKNVLLHCSNYKMMLKCGNNHINRFSGFRNAGSQMH